MLAKSKIKEISSQEETESDQVSRLSVLIDQKSDLEKLALNALLSIEELDIALQRESDRLKSQGYPPEDCKTFSMLLRSLERRNHLDPDGDDMICQLRETNSRVSLITLATNLVAWYRRGSPLNRS